MSLILQTFILFVGITGITFTISKITNQIFSIKKILLLILILSSISIGSIYAFSVVIPKLKTSLSLVSQESFSLLAAIIFLTSQVVSIILIFKNDQKFFKWLIPVSIYLFIIGIYQWVYFQIEYPLFLDSLRALMLMLSAKTVSNEMNDKN